MRLSEIQWSVWKSPGGKTRCFASSPRSIAEEGVEALKKWTYLGQQYLPRTIEAEVVGKVKSFPHYIVVTEEGEVIQVLT